MSTKKRSKNTLMSRNNKMIKRLATWLWVNFGGEYCDPDRQYDKAAELLKKIQNNDFTGEDTHKD